MQIAQHILHLGAGEWIERAEGLVHQQDFRLGGQSARQADALALPSGELMRKAARKARRIKADGCKQFMARGGQRSGRGRPSASRTSPTLRSTVK